MITIWAAIWICGIGMSRYSLDELLDPLEIARVVADEDGVGLLVEADGEPLGNGFGRAGAAPAQAQRMGGGGFDGMLTGGLGV